MGESLSPKEWANIYANDETILNVLNKIRNRDYSEWTREMLKICKQAKSVCELGVGTGESSLALASMGCDVTCVDFSMGILNSVGRAADALGLAIKTQRRDVLQPPDKDSPAYDIVFSCGLLEHLECDERITVLHNYKRHCKKMVSMIPNSSSLAYSLGKERQERNGTWKWGKELPSHTQIREFMLAGYEVENEYSIGEKHALNFLECDDELRKYLHALWASSNIENNYHQGYLLVTIGI
jgi:cyclopropane fatty-acyl-phospholipid synthase-like methyltransferase